MLFDRLLILYKLSYAAAVSKSEYLERWYAYQTKDKEAEKKIRYI